MVDPLIVWNDVELFLSLLERTGDVHVRLYPRKEKERKEGSSGTALSFTLLVKEGQSIAKTSAGSIREIEAALRKPEYQEHSFGSSSIPEAQKKRRSRRGGRSGLRPMEDSPSTINWRCRHGSVSPLPPSLPGADHAAFTTTGWGILP